MASEQASRVFTDSMGHDNEDNESATKPADTLMEKDGARSTTRASPGVVQQGVALYTEGSSSTAAGFTDIDLKSLKSEHTNPTSRVSTRSGITPGASKTVLNFNPDYFTFHAQPYSDTRNTSQPGLDNSSVTTSSASLQALLEETGLDLDSETSRRAPSSARCRQNSSRKSRISHTKSSSSSHPSLARPSSPLEYPFYPDQSFQVLQTQFYPTRPAPVLRSRSSHPSQNSLYTEGSEFHQQSKDRSNLSPRTRTTGNTPMASPNPFSLPSSRPYSVSEDENAKSSPHLHYTHHLQQPKETKVAESVRDVFTGNKILNSYEILEELGRGQHGKVKKGRDIGNGMFVAIKIVPRYSNKRRLGKLGAPEDRVKKEVAILKKARHENVVGLLEVIDDPNKNKVYIILEFVERGEIRWRQKGYPEIVTMHKVRLERERRGLSEITELQDSDIFLLRKARRRWKYLQQNPGNRYALDSPNWSPEHGGITDDEEDAADPDHVISRPTTSPTYVSRIGIAEDRGQPADLTIEAVSSPDFAILNRARTSSLATSSVSQMSSEIDWEIDSEEHSYVPTLTLQEARNAFRDSLLGLEFLHFQGIIHRDIKPANLLVTEDGRVKISDFGVSYLGRPVSDQEEGKLAETDATTLDDPRELSRTVGTPAFYAPELCSEDPLQFGCNEDGKGPKITGAIDIWALGITLYAMIYGRLPFYAANHMGLYQVICESELFLPKRRLMPVEQFHNLHPSATQIDPTGHNGKRLDHEFRYEDVPQTLQNLIAALLTKHPSRRISVENAKKHPWVIEDIENPGKWIAETDPKAEGKSKISVDEKDVSRAVLKLTIFERASQALGKIAGSIIGRSGSAKGAGRVRAESSATSPAASTDTVESPSASSASTVGKERKGKDAHSNDLLRGDDVIAAIRASREPEHPLAQSQSASPADETPPSIEEAFGAGTVSTTSTPLPGHECRPRGPERAISAISTADSVRTIRAAYQPERWSPQLGPSNEEIGSPGPVEGPTTKLAGIFSGAGKRLSVAGSRDRGGVSADRSPSADRDYMSSDAHASPSLALSTASASGDFQSPDALREELQSASVPKPNSNLGSGTPARHHSYFQPQASSPVAFQQAQEVNQRRQVREAAAAAAAAEQAASRPTLSRQASSYECPPSPDDETAFRAAGYSSGRSSPHPWIQHLPSASTLASSSPDGYVGGISQSTSNPSMPSVVSGASSMSGEASIPTEKAPTYDGGASTEPSFMRTAETVTADDQPVIASGQPLEARYTEQEHFVDDDADNEEEDDSSGDEGIVMGAPSKK